MLVQRVGLDHLRRCCQVHLAHQVAFEVVLVDLGLTAGRLDRERYAGLQQLAGASALVDRVVLGVEVLVQVVAALAVRDVSDLPLL